MIGDYLKPPKNDYKLDRALWWMDRFREEIETIPNISNIHDLFKSLEIDNIIQCATLSAVASKARTESRWIPWHYRSDFPDTDNEKWLKHVVLTQGETPADVQVAFKNIVKMNK